MGYIDLHVHSTMSNGSLSPESLVKLACEKGLYAISITDHESVSGIYPALQTAKTQPVRIVPGVEISCVLGRLPINILGYFIDYTDPSLISSLRAVSGFRDERNIKICSQLRTYGIDIEYEEFRDFVGCRMITRNHFAAYLSAGGYVENRYEAFDRYLGKGRPCYIPLHRIKAYDAVKIILSAHGLPVAAHPVRYRLDENGYIRMFTMLKSFGLRGIEALYSDNTYEDESMLTKLASQLGLFITGGSGFHGSYKPEIELGTGRGNLMVPQELLDEMIRSR